MGSTHAQQTFVMEEISDHKDIVQQSEGPSWQIVAFGSYGAVTLKPDATFIIIVRSSSCVSAGDVNMVLCMRGLTLSRHVPSSATEQWANLPRLSDERATVPSSDSFHLSEKADRRPAANGAEASSFFRRLLGGVENGRR